MEQISLTGATLLSDHPGQLVQVELTNFSSSPAAAASSHHHDHNHDHGHNHHAGDDNNHNASCSHHPRTPNMMMIHPLIQALPANIPALVQGGTNAELFEALCTFIRLSRTLEERNDWFKKVLEELKQQPLPSPQMRLWQVITTTSPDENGHTLFHWAAKRSDDARFLQILLEYAAAASASSQAVTASAATSASSPSPMTMTLTHIINQASVDSVGMTPLHWACTEHSQKHVQLLLQYGANVESIDQSGCTPLLIAAQYGHVDLVAMLLRRGHANGLAVDKSLDTALHWAAYKGSMAVCGVLTFLVPQLSYRTPDAFGQTPLHLAALRGHTSVVRYILANLHYTAGAGTSSSGGGGGSGDHHHPIDIMDDDDEEDDQERMLLLSTSFLSTSPRRRQRQRLLLKTKEDLLYLRDSQGRTPLELAMFKQRPSVAALLQHEMDQLKLQQAYASASTPYIKKVTLYAQHTLKTMCSLHNWKVWMGCRPTSAAAIHDEVDESPKFPFYLVISIIIAHVLFYLTVLTPILAVEQGLLWDFMGWHLLNWLWMVACWYCFYKIATTSPGYVGGVGGSSRSSSSSSSSGGGKGGGVLRRGGSHRSSRSSSLTTSTRTHVDSKPLRQRSYSQAALTKKWRRRYEQVLDSYAVDDEDAMTANGTAGATAKLKALRERQLCHTCHIARPLRSKHCRVARRCVLMFDHHCPFVGNTIGLYNYMWFYLTLIFMTLCLLGFLITWAIYLMRYSKQHHPMPWKIFWTGLFIGIWILPSGGMAIYHTQLSMVNLTTNEHQNLARYKYLHDPVTGRYRNPWFQGWFTNMMQRFTPSEASYTLPEEEDEAEGDDREDEEPLIQQV